MLFQKEVSYKLSKKLTILEFFDEIFLIKVLDFQNFDQKLPKTEQKTEVYYKKVHCYVALSNAMSLSRFEYNIRM